MADDKLTRALDELAEAEERATESRQRQLLPPPPDPELEELFLSFARRMAGTPSLQFWFSEGQDEDRVVHRSGFRGRKVRVETLVRDAGHEIDRGWIVHMGGPGSLYLGISLDGLPYVVTSANGGLEFTGDRVFVRLPESLGYRLGRPLGPDLRLSLIQWLKLEPVKWPETPKREDVTATKRGFSYVITDSDGRKELPQVIIRNMAIAMKAAGVS